MPPRRETLHWWTIDKAINKPGVYAWYYKPQLTNHDIDVLITTLKTAEAVTRGDLVREFLQRHIFDPLSDGPYTAAIRGPLKPTYEGALHIKAAISDDAVARIASNPERLRQIKAILEASVPDFSSPIYIGMATNLQRRLVSHKAAINRLKHTVHPAVELDETVSEDQYPTQSFAAEVVRRNLSVNNLIAVTQTTEFLSDEYKDAENILNRLSFPICGRN
jgi:hypothetical protein